MGIFFEKLVTNTPVVTNHCIYTNKNRREDNQESYSRFDKILSSYENIQGKAKKEDVRDCIHDVSYEDITQWSIVYDLQKKALDFYWQ